MSSQGLFLHKQGLCPTVCLPSVLHVSRVFLLYFCQNMASAASISPGQSILVPLLPKRTELRISFRIRRVSTGIIPPIANRPKSFNTAWGTHPAAWEHRSVWARGSYYGTHDSARPRRSLDSDCFRRRTSSGEGTGRIARKLRRNTPK